MSDPPLATQPPFLRKDRPDRYLVGILVGGKSTRMRGEPKGLLDAPDDSKRTLVGRIADEVRAALPNAELVLVGAHPAYAALGWPQLTDAAPDKGPLGGLVALMRYAAHEAFSSVVVLSCDLPYVSSALLERLARERPEARILCPQSDGVFEPLFARYHVECLLDFEDALAADQLSLQPLLRHPETRILALTAPERQQVLDWDCPQDLARREA